MDKLFATFSNQYQGKARAVLVILTVISYALTSPQIADLGWTWVTMVLGGASFLQQVVSRFTKLGDVPA